MVLDNVEIHSAYCKGENITVGIEQTRGIMDGLRGVAEAQYRQDIKDFRFWGECYCEVQNIPQRQCGHCWQEFFKSLAEG